MQLFTKLLVSFYMLYDNIVCVSIHSNTNFTVLSLCEPFPFANVAKLTSMEAAIVIFCLKNSPIFLQNIIFAHKYLISGNRYLI